MKKLLFIISVSLCCVLAACGSVVKSDGTVDSEPVTAASTTAVTTTSQTTTTKPSTTTVTAKTDIPDTVVLTVRDTVEVYDGLNILDLVTDTNTKLKELDTKIDTSELGEKKLTIKFDYEDTPYEKEVIYNVVDTTEPLLLNSGWDPYTVVNQPLDLNSMVGYVDNYDRSPTLTYTGEVDTSKTGHYGITATVTDSSGNSTSWDMTVFVVNEKPAPGDYNTRVSFRDFCDAHPYENVSYGIDVSAWQTNVDFEAVKSEGCEFVIMRMGYYYSQVKMDDYYHQNMQRATDAGLQVGVYFYTADNTEEGVREHARWIVEQLDGRQLDFPVAFDWEEWGTFQQYGMNIHDLNCLFDAFCDELEQYGYSGMLYSSKNFLNNFWENKYDRPVWLAHFVDETNYEGSYAIWQGSAYGRIAGINGDVDMNIRYNDVPLY